MGRGKQQQQQQQPPPSRPVRSVELHIVAVPANSSFGHSTHVVKRRSAPPRLALARIRTTTTTNTSQIRHVITTYNSHTGFSSHSATKSAPIRHVIITHTFHPGFSPLAMQSQPRNLPPYHPPTFPGPKPRVLTRKPHSARKSLRRMLIFPYLRRLPSVNVACARFRLYARARELKNLWPTWVSEAENRALKARASTLIVHYTQQLSRASVSLAATVVAQQASITSMLQDPLLPALHPSSRTSYIASTFLTHWPLTFDGPFRLFMQYTELSSPWLSWHTLLNSSYFIIGSHAWEFWRPCRSLMASVYT